MLTKTVPPLLSTTSDDSYGLPWVRVDSVRSGCVPSFWYCTNLLHSRGTRQHQKQKLSGSRALQTSLNAMTFSGWSCVVGLSGGDPPSGAGV